jgi:hypothetical protein
MDEKISLHDYRSMLDIMSQQYPPTTFLRDTFFGRTKQHASRNLDIDVVKGNRRVAISVNPQRTGRTVGRIGYKTKSYTPPYFKEKKILTGQDLLTRQPGQIIYQDDGGLEGLIATNLGEDLMDLQMRFTRAEELQAAQLLQTGKCKVYEDDEAGVVSVVDEIDFGIDAGNLVTIADDWADLTNGDPVRDLNTLMRLGGQKSGLTMVDIVMGEAAADLYMAHPKTHEYYDKLRINIGSIEPVKDSDGSMIIGPFRGAVIREYSALYVDPVTGSEASLIDPYKVIVTTRQADFRRHYGLIVDVAEGVASAVPRFPKIFKSDDPAALMLMLQSSFLLAPHQIDAVVCATVGAP